MIRFTRTQDKTTVKGPLNYNGRDIESMFCTESNIRRLVVQGNVISLSGVESARGITDLTSDTVHLVSPEKAGYKLVLTDDHITIRSPNTEIDMSIPEDFTLRVTHKEFKIKYRNGTGLTLKI